MSDIIDINVAQTVEEITINATPNLIEVNINNMNAGKHSDLILDDGTNPHGTTKTDVGLSNVPNLDTTNAVNLAHTHSNFSALNALSGTNTGDETTLSIQTKRPLKTINSTSLEGSGNIEINVDFSTHNLEELQNVTSTNYTTPIDTDSLLTYDATNLLWKRLSWSNIKSNLKTYFDGIYTTTSAVATQITTALNGYATQTWVTSQGYITNVITSLGFTPENIANKSTLTTLGTSNTLYPTQNAVKTYVDNKNYFQLRFNMATLNWTTLDTTWRGYGLTLNPIISTPNNQAGTTTTPTYTNMLGQIVNNCKQLKKAYFVSERFNNIGTLEFHLMSKKFDQNQESWRNFTNLQVLINQTLTLSATDNGRNQLSELTINAHNDFDIFTSMVLFVRKSNLDSSSFHNSVLILEFEKS